MGGQPLDLADASFRFQAFPRLAVAVLLWAGDDEFPAQARVLFDAVAGHYLPTEDLAGTGDWLAHKLVHAPISAMRGKIDGCKGGFLHVNGSPVTTTLLP